MLPKPTRALPGSQLGSMYGYGAAYAIASLSCTIAPFLAVIGTTLKHGSTLTGPLAFVAYATGMTITVGVAAVAVAIAGSSAAKVARRILPYAGRIGGVIALLTGLYVTYYGYYEIRLFFGGASPDDPIIKTAGVVPAWLVQQIDTVGVWPLLAALAVLLASSGRSAETPPRRSPPSQRPPQLGLIH